jgi:hypothetical protein
MHSLIFHAEALEVSNFKDFEKASSDFFQGYVKFSSSNNKGRICRSFFSNQHQANKQIRKTL